MAQLNQMFDATQHDPTQSNGMLPVGRLKLIATASEIKDISNDRGKYLQFTLEVIEGPEIGKTGGLNFNLYHNDEKVRGFAYRDFSAFCHVTGVYRVEDSSQLHNIPFYGDVQPQKDDPTKTQVRKFFDVNGNEPGKQSAPAAFQQPVTQQAAPQTQAQPMQTQAPIEQQPAAQPAQTMQSFANQAPVQGQAQWGNQPAQTPPAGGFVWDKPQQ